MNERFTELLPWYVNGTLDADDRAWVDAQLREHPELASELQWVESLQTQLREAAPQVSDEIGLDRALARIAQAKREAQAWTRTRPAAPPAAPGWLGRVREWFGEFGLKPSMALALAVIAVQAGFLAQMTLTSKETSEIRAMRPSPVVQGPLLKVNFKPDATEADIRLLLVEIQGSLAGGPGQLGDYYLRVPAERVSAATDRLKASRIVEAVAVVDAIPVKE
jgi:hypothetical protein